MVKPKFKERQMTGHIVSERLELTKLLVQMMAAISRCFLAAVMLWH
jgi:hypothetical protein